MAWVLLIVSVLFTYKKSLIISIELMVTLPERSLSTSAVMLLFMNHSNSGAGDPKALQVSVTVSPPDTVTSVGSVGNVRVGGATHRKILKKCLCNEPCLNILYIFW